MIEQRTRVPELLAGLADLVTGALPGVQVIVGPPGARNVEDDAVIIGMHDEQAAVDATIEKAEGLGNRLMETYEVRCGLSASNGGDDFQVLVSRARDMLGAITDALKADPAVSGSVNFATIGADQSWIFTTTPAGIDVTVWWSVLARAAL